MTLHGITLSAGTTLPASRATGVASVHEARGALGRRLRELRQAAALSGRQLAESLSWPASKVSKLETGRQTPSDDDVRAWTGATGSRGETEPLLAALHTLEVQHAEWQRQLRGGLRPHQARLAEMDAKTRLLRAFESTVIPGLLQTAEYARARLAQGSALFAVPHDLDEAIQARIERQQVLYRSTKRFHFIITEAALRLRLCPPEVMLGQLDRLVSLSTLPNLSLGIIGFEAQYTIAPWHGFWLLDNERVMVETYSAELNLAQPQEVELYARVFDTLAGIASHGRSARTVLARVADDLAQEVPDDSE